MFPFADFSLLKIFYFFCRFVGNLFCYLAYPVTTQTTTVLLPSSTIESYTKTKPVSLADSTLTYGPHKNTAAFSSAELVVHSENNSPMLVVSRLERVVEVIIIMITMIIMIIITVMIITMTSPAVDVGEPGCGGD